MTDLQTGWHVDKRVSVGHIITTLTVAIGFVIWMIRMEGMVLVNQSRIEANRAAVARVENDNSVQYAEIIRRLERIDDRLNGQ